MRDWPAFSPLADRTVNHIDTQTTSSAYAQPATLVHIIIGYSSSGNRMLGVSVRSILDQSLEELREWLAGQGQPAYRADADPRLDFSATRDEFRRDERPAAATAPKTVGQSSHRHVENLACIVEPTTAPKSYCWPWPTISRIECVLIREQERRTICISTQVGCAMGCVFCASGLDGVVRNLTTGEIVEQMLHLQRLLPADERLSNIVVMGMGEPLANLAGALAGAARGDKSRRLGNWCRKITVSTVGCRRPWTG